MNDYSISIQSLQNPTFGQIRKVAENSLSPQDRLSPWVGLNHGVDLLDTHEKCCRYLLAYGEMHELKIKTALSSIDNPQSVFNNHLTIVDWGCGQGLATVCFFDFLKENNLPNNVQTVILIEPSPMALERAKLHVNAYLKDESKIQPNNKFLNDVEKSDITTNQPVTLHFLSNILDISTINLEKLAQLTGKNIDGEHYFFCVGPLNLTSTRIEEFAKHLNITDEQIIEKHQGKLTNTRGTIKLLVFKIKENRIEIINIQYSQIMFNSFLIKPFNLQQDNNCFRNLYHLLYNKYGLSQNKCVLIGNLNINEHAIDALFIMENKIVIIDFKNHQGKISFSENNPWKIDFSVNGSNNFKFISGNGAIRNPYQQVNAYRFSLIDLLNNNREHILETNSNVDWKNIDSLVWFQQAVTFDSNAISENIQQHFSIASFNNCVEVIEAFNPSIKLSNNEIDNILKVLNINEVFLYNGDNINTQVTQQQASNLQYVNRVLAGLNKNSIKDNLNLYCKLLIDIERVKSQTLSNNAILPYALPLNDAVTVDITQNPSFLVAFNQNKMQNFPKKLFIGLNVLVNNVSVPLFYAVTDAINVPDPKSICVLDKEFLIFEDALSERDYPDDLIEQINIKVSQQQTIQQKMEIINKELSDDSIIFSNSITLALCEDNPYTSQLVFELKKMSISPKSLLHKFLYKEPIDNNLPQIDENNFISITSLNKSQKQAVALAFNQPLAVITGPPGTGKTQVVLNILANAIYHNKKVLFASKNNKAVDNVKDKLDLKIAEQFLLRFGKKDNIRNNTVPAIRQFVNKIHNQIFEDKSFDLLQIKNQLQHNLKTITDSKKSLQRIGDLPPEIEQVEKNIKDINLKIENVNSQIRDFWVKNWFYRLFNGSNRIKLEKEEKQFVSDLDKENKTLSNKKTELQELQSQSYNFKQAILKAQQANTNEETGKEYVNLLINEKLRKTNSNTCQRFANYIPDNIPRDNENSDFIGVAKSFIDTFNIVAITSLSIKSAFPFEEELFDIVVIDEASQCDIVSAIPLLKRAKQLVVIGDPLQLKHITSVEPYEENYILEQLNIDKKYKLDYVNKSLYDYCWDLSIESTLKGIMLNEHYRCHPDIIGYSNTSFYLPQSGQELDVKTVNNKSITPNGIKWIDVVGQADQNKLCNKSEAEKTVEIALSIIRQNPEISIGITTPFKDQVKEIKQKISQDYTNKIFVDTVHQFQGDEKDVMIFSTVVSDNSKPYTVKWLNETAYLINVAVTRAKSTLYIVGNKNYCKAMPKNTPLYKLAAWAEQH